MNKYFFHDFPAEEMTEFPGRVKSVSLHDPNGNLIDLRSAPDGKKMKLTVNPTTRGNRSYIGWFSNLKNESVVVFKPGEYFVVE